MGNGAKILRNTLKILVLIRVNVQLIFDDLVLSKHIFKLKLNSFSVFLIFVDQKWANILGVHAFGPEEEPILFLFFTFCLAIALAKIRMQKLMIVRMIGLTIRLPSIPLLILSGLIQWLLF